MTTTTPQPVAARYYNQFNGWVVTHIDHAKQMHIAKGYPMQLLYTEPVQAAQPRKPLTELDIKSLWLGGWVHTDDWQNVVDFARAIEVAHGIAGVRLQQLNQGNGSADGSNHERA